MTKYIYEEKTAPSAPICSFEDGVDGISTKSLVVTIPPTLSGVSALTETQTGQNLFDKTKATIGKYINVNGQEATNVIKAHSALLPLKPSTTYYMSGHADASYYSILALDKDMNVLSTWYGGASKTESFVATTPNNARWCYLNFNADQIDSMIFAESSSAISYVAYNGATYTANLGRTIHGGTADIVNGTGQETHGKKVFDGTEGTGGTPSWTMISVTQGTMFRITISDKVTTSATNTICSYYTPVAQAQRADGTVSGAGTNVDIIDNRFSSVDAFKAWLAENPVTLVYELATSTDFTFDGQEIPTKQGYNAFWSDSGDTEVTYYIQIPVEERYVIGGEILSDIADAIREKKESTAPILTEDMADEILSIVTGKEPQVPIASSTLIADNSTLSETVTFTDDYHNYDILKIELYRTNVTTVVYATSDMLDTIAQYSYNSINFNELGNNQYVCYWKTSGTVWTRRNNRNINIKYIYGLKFTNCTPVKTVFYSRQSISGNWVSFSPPEGKSFTKDYDYILFSTKTGENDETQPCNNVFCPSLIEKTRSLFGEPFDNIYPIVLNQYNGTIDATITDTSLTSYNYFYVVGIKLIFE